MNTVKLYARVRRAVLVEGLSQRAVAREFGLARKTVRKLSIAVNATRALLAHAE